MKKTFPLFLILTLFVLAAGTFAEEDQASEAADKNPTEADQRDEAVMAPEIQKTGPETIRQEDALSDGTETRPAVAVKKKIAEPALKARVAVPALSSADISDQDMKVNWEDFFSKGLTSENIVSYTVQPGDSLYKIAHKNHTTVDLIKKMNGLKQDVIRIGMKLKLFKGAFSVIVSKSENTLALFADSKPIKKYRVSTGKNNSTPAGEFKITDKLVNPTWFKTGAIYPPGSPDNALGTRWLGFDLPAYGIHGTIEPENIGKAVSEGCIRMMNEDVEELYGMVPSGTKVTVTD